MTLTASSGSWPINTGTSSLIMPALFKAISEILFPKNDVCSRLTDVITDKIGVKMFVASVSPPIPHSITQISHFSLIKCCNPT